MPLIQKQLVLAITLAMGVTCAQYAQARDDRGPGGQWFEKIAKHNQKAHFDPAIPAPEDFYFVDRANSRNGLNVAQVLDSAVDAALASDELSDWEKYQLENYGLKLSSLDPGRLGALLEQLAGSQNANLGTATQNSMKLLNASLLTAIRQLDNDEDGRVWLQGLGSTGTLDAQHGSAGLKQRSQGLLLGADGALDDAWRIGVVGGKSGSDLSARHFKGEVDSWHLGAYAVRQDGPWALRLGALYSNHSGQNKRDVDFDFIDYRERLTGKYKAQSQNAFAELGHQFVTDGLRAEPFAGIGFQRYHRDRFQEKGGYSALNVGTQTQQNLNSTFGLRLSHDIVLANQITLKPHLSVHWKHLYGDTNSRVRQSFAREAREDFNSAFSIGGTSLDRDNLALRTGLDVRLSEHQTLSIAYTAEVADNSRNHGLMGQWQSAF